YFFLAGFCVLVYDHILIFPQEIVVIWKQKKMFRTTVRFLLYASTTIVYSSQRIYPRCAQWMLFLPLDVTVPLSVLPSFLMSIRVWAMYTANRTLLILLLLYLAVQTVAGLWQYTVPSGTPAPDPVNNY
ncbi:hypothetical protein BC835DRAFT_1293673, partial [Cytidiella melzeri]